MINRRDVLAGLGAAASMGLAGCGDDGATDENLGERVPQLTIDFFATLGKINEDYAQGSMQDLQEHLNLDIEASGREHTALVNDLYADNRRSLLPLYIFALEPDPNFSTRRLMAHQAGSGIGSAGQNTSQWVNCDFSVRASMQSRAASTEERRQLINEAWSIASHDLVLIPISTRAYINGFRTDQIDPDDDIWPVDFAPHLFQSFFKISPTADNDVIRAEGTGTMFEVPGNPYLYTSQQHLANTLVRSPLLMYDKEQGYEIRNNLASSVDRSENGETITVELRDDATFHNGDPVTAEDVKFTFDYGVAGARAGQHQFAPTLDTLEQIVEVDERTVRFELSESYAPLVDREFPTWGIFHKDSWMDVLSEHGVDSFDSHEHDFDSFDEVEMGVDDMTGCGPYEMVDFVPAESISLVRAGDHPVHEPECDIEFVNRRDAASRLAGLQSGDINVATLEPGQVRQVEDDPDIMTVSQPRIQHWAFFSPNHAAAPTKFREFRQAVAMALNRQEMVEVSQRGYVDPEMYSTVYSETHPWRPPEDMLYRMAEDGSGNPEQARQLLEDAGWGWDGNDNLRYPPDADLSDAWPAEGTPDPENYPCLNEDGYVRPEGYELSRDQVPGYDD